MDAVKDPNALTPVENRNGRWYKREDLHRNDYGVNGAKYRACRQLMTTAIVRDGVDAVVSAQSVRSPQAAITATLAEELGLACTIVVGASKPETAVKHPSIRIAVEAGAELDTTPRMAYNTVIQPYATRLAAERGAWQVPYAISPPEDATVEELQGFLSAGGNQVRNIPDSVETLVLPFGSGNSTAGVLYGLSTYGTYLKRIVLVGVGPDRTSWLESQLVKAGSRLPSPEMDDIELLHIPLHGWYAEYADLMPETSDGIVLHPTYEGKVVRFLNETEPDWWTVRDESTMLWIIGGPI